MGIYDAYNIDYGHVIPSLIHKLFLAKRDGGNLEVWGDGSAKREFLLADDLARVMYKILELEKIPIFNVHLNIGNGINGREASSEDETLKELLEKREKSESNIEKITTQHKSKNDNQLRNERAKIRGEKTK